MSLLNAAKALVKKGFSCIATNENKISISPWAKFQKTLPTVRELEKQFSDDRAAGLAVICGAISDNLEVIDIDVKYDLSGSLFENLMNLIQETSPEISKKLKIIQTRSGGYHLYYRCSNIEGNKKLAQRKATDDEIKRNPNDKVYVLVETRGEGGYVVAPPTEGYKVISEAGNVNELTPEQRETLLEICRSFNQYVVEQAKPAEARSNAFSLTPWEDYNSRGIDDMLSLLQKHGWTVVDRKGERIVFKRPGKTESKTSGDYHYGLNLFTVFTTSSEFEPGKGYKPAAVFTILECAGNFHDAAVKLADLGYGEKKQNYGEKLEKELFQKKLDGYTKEDLVKVVATRLKKDEQVATEIVETYERQWGPSYCTFWEIENGRVVISRSKLENFLHKNGGYSLYFYDKSSNIFKIVKVCNGIVEEASPEQIKKFIKKYILSLPDTFDGGITPIELLELVYKGADTYFSKSFFEFIDHRELDFLKDTPTQTYFPFKNGIVVIDANTIQLKQYNEIDKVIWKSQIIPFDIVIDQKFEVTDCEFFRFLEKVCGDDEQRWLYACTLIGYLLHTHKDPSRPYAVIIAEETDNEAEGGGTGKGIFVKALSYMIKTERMDGKNFKLDKNFAFQRVNLDTKLVSIEDVRKNVDFEGFFSIITEGMTVEKKNKDELYIPFDDSPKILITTNYSITNSSKASQRRQKVLEFVPFFSPRYTPVDFFGHILFDNWDRDEWNRFYNFMFACSNMYLQGGVKNIESSEKLKRKHLKISFGEEFLELWDSLVSGNEMCSEWKGLGETYKNFVVENGLSDRNYSLKRFKKAMESYAETYGFRFEMRKNSDFGGRKEFRIWKGIMSGSHIPVSIPVNT